VAFAKGACLSDGSSCLEMIRSNHMWRS
jgi:hypothetical protein